MATLTTTFQKLNEVSIYTGSYLQTWGKYTTQSTTNNQSTVVMELRIHNNSGTGYSCYTHSCNFTGGVFDASDYKGSYLHGWDAGDHVLLSQTKNVAHNQDGTLSFNIGGYFTCSAGIGGTVPQVSVSLPKINRRSDFSLSKSTFNIGDTIQATITQYVSAYHQDLYIQIGSTEHLIQSSATGTVDIDTSLLANQIYQQIPNAKSYTSEFRLKTLDSNNTLIGTVVKSYTANVVNSNPTFNVAYEDTNATTTAITSNNQQIIQNNSTLRIKITGATAQHYSTLSSYSININGAITSGSISSSSKNVDIGTLNLSSNTNATITLTDSRGFTTTKTLAITILEWKLPYADISLNRQQNYYTQSTIKADATYSSLDSKNTLTLQYRIKKTSASTWGSWYSLTNNTTTTFNADNLYSWDVQVKLTDKIGTTTYNLVLPVGMAILFIDRLKQSIGVNCFPVEDNSLEVNGGDISNTYSTTERAIGKWIDGSTIYKKTFNVGAVSSTTQIDHNISNFGKLVKVYGVGGNQGVYNPIQYVNTSSYTNQYAVVVSNTKIFLTKGSNASDFDECYITLEYTKSS